MASFGGRTSFRGASPFLFFSSLCSLIGVASFGGRTSFRGASPFFLGGEQGTLGGDPRAYSPGGPGGEWPGEIRKRNKNYGYGDLQLVPAT